MPRSRVPRAPDYTLLALDAEQAAGFERDCRELCANYLRLEDPTDVREIGLELRLEAAVGELTLRGIIDRLELDAHGELIVTDYKTGRAPSPNWERKSLSGVTSTRSCASPVFGKRPAAIRLMYLKSGEIITATPTEQSTRFMTTRTSAVWKAVATACERDDFRPRPGALCNWCAYQQVVSRVRRRPRRGRHRGAGRPRRPRPHMSTPRDWRDAIRRFDDAVDAALEPVRDHPVISPVMTAATTPASSAWSGTPARSSEG